MRLAVFAVLVWASGSVAAPPVTVPSEVQGEVSDFVTIRAKTDGKAVKFVALDPGLRVFPSDLLSDKKATVVTASKPGRYRLLAYSSVKDDPTEPAVVTVVIGGAAPVPPTPVDPDPPAPKVESVWVIVVEDADAVRTVETAKLLNDTYWPTLKPKHDFRFYLSDAQTAKENGYTDAAKAVGYPAVLVVNAKDGDVLKAFKSNGTIGQVQDAVKGVVK